MQPIQIIVGSMLGGSEYVAEACQQVLDENNFTTQLHLTPNFSEISHQNQTWLICTSTHGAGDYPDNILEFIADLENCDQDLSTVSFIVIGIGDSNYDTFCFAAKNIEKLLISKGCKSITESFHIDMAQDVDPEDLAQTWLSTKVDQL